VLCEDEQASIIKYYLGSFIEEVEAVFLYFANYNTKISSLPNK
jgi:hypothetical protein